MAQTKKKMTKAERRRRKKIKAILRLAAAAAVLIGVIVLVIVLIVSCSNKAAAGKQAEAESAAQAESESASLAEAEALNAAQAGDAPGLQNAAQASYTDEEYAEAGVNELGGVPILMYHRIYEMTNAETDYTGGNVDADGYNRTSEALEADLEQYYEWGYRCIRLKDFMEGNIYAEFGSSPLVITFDDGMQQALIDGFDANGDPIFSDNSALAILERVKERHPDFNVTATFFLNAGLFGNGEEKDKQLINWMVDHGYDIGNHTKDHEDLATLSESEIEEQIGYMYNKLEEIIPGKYIDIIALPFGSPTDTSADGKYEKIFAGTYDGKSYSSSASLICGWTYESSCFSGEIDYTYVKRIRGYDNNGEDFDIEMNFDLLNSGRRYVSDGNPNTIVVPEGGGMPAVPGEKNIITYTQGD